MKQCIFKLVSAIQHLLAYVVKYVWKVFKWLESMTVSKQGGDTMTQNQIAYWANVERERTNRANEAISRAKQESEAALNKAKEQESEAKTLQSKHSIVQGYLDTKAGKTTGIAAAALAAKALGVSDDLTDAKRAAINEQKSAIKNNVKRKVKRVADILTGKGLTGGSKTKGGRR